MILKRISALAAAAFLLVACEDPTAVRDTVPPTLGRYQLFALSGTPLIYPNALDLLRRQAVRAEISGAAAVPFDLAFDLAAGGQVVIYPALAILSTRDIVGARSVRLQPWEPAATAFDAALTAPDRGYVADSTLTVAVGRTVAFELPLPPSFVSPFDLQCSRNPIYRGKMIVDSVSPARELFVRVVINENCGGRNLDTRSTT